MASFNIVSGVKAKAKMIEIEQDKEDMITDQLNKLNSIATNVEEVYTKISDLNLTDSLVSLVNSANEEAKICNVKLRSAKEALVKLNNDVNNGSSKEVIKESVIDSNYKFSEALKSCQDINSTLNDILIKSDCSVGNSTTSFTFTSDYFKNFNDYFSTLTFEQSFAIVHILGSVVIFISLTSLISVVYGNMLIDYFKMEKKYPKIARFINLRRKFQLYYSMIDFFIIFSVIIIMTVVDVQLFFI